MILLPSSLRLPDYTVFLTDPEGFRRTPTTRHEVSSPAKCSDASARYSDSMVSLFDSALAVLVGDQWTESYISYDG